MPVNNNFCNCDNLKKAIAEKVIAFDGKHWHINGCCGQCFMLSKIVFCPYCAMLLPKRNRATPGAGKTKLVDGKRKKQPPKLDNQPAFEYDTDTIN